MKPVTDWNLTDRQVEVLEAVIKHGDHKLVSKILHIDVRTVEAHMSNIYRKAGMEFGEVNTGARIKLCIAYDRHTRAVA